jgi:hypothetical protein
MENAGVSQAMPLPVQETVVTRPFWKLPALGSYPLGDEPLAMRPEC